MEMMLFYLIVKEILVLLTKRIYLNYQLTDVGGKTIKVIGLEEIIVMQVKRMG